MNNKIANIAKRLPALILILSVISIFILYFPALYSPFFNDDINLLHDGRDFNLSVFNPFQSQGLYRPLWKLYFAAMYRVFGLNPLPYHLANIVLHVINCLLLYLVVKPLAKSSVRASLVALLFAISSKITNGVHWISSSNALLATAFSFVAILMFLKYLNSRDYKWLVISCLTSILALLTRETSIILIGLIWLADTYGYRKGDKIRDIFTIKNRWKPYLPLIIIFGVYFAVYLLKIMAHPLAPESQYTFNAFMLFKFYEFTGNVFFNSTLWHSGVLLIAVAVYTILSKDREWKFGILWFSFAILPYIPQQWLGTAERYNYLAVPGFCVFFFALFCGLYQYFKKLRWLWANGIVLLLVAVYLGGAVVSVMRDIDTFDLESRNFFNELVAIETKVGKIKDGGSYRVKSDIHAPYIEQYIELKRGLNDIHIDIY
jgi:hypothetical protein